MSEEVINIPCAVIRAGELVMLAIEARPGRGVVRIEGEPLTWRCADGRLERLYIEHSSADRVLVAREMADEGLLVAEMAEGLPLSAESVRRREPHYWVLSSEGTVT